MTERAEHIPDTSFMASDVRRSPDEMFQSVGTMSSLTGPVARQQQNVSQTHSPRFRSLTEKRHKAPTVRGTRNIQKPKGRLFNTRDERRYTTQLMEQS